MWVRSNSVYPPAIPLAHSDFLSVLWTGYLDCLVKVVPPVLRFEDSFCYNDLAADRCNKLAAVSSLLERTRQMPQKPTASVPSFPTAVEEDSQLEPA